MSAVGSGGHRSGAAKDPRQLPPFESCSHREELAVSWNLPWLLLRFSAQQPIGSFKERRPPGKSIHDNSIGRLEQGILEHRIFKQIDRNPAVADDGP
jgi:hypothetical protein